MAKSAAATALIREMSVEGYRAMKILLAFICLAMSALTTASAEGLNCWGIQADTTIDQSEEFEAGRIDGRGPAQFSNPLPTCFSARCWNLKQSYLVAGDPVIVTSTTPDYRCVTYANPGKRLYWGWLPTGRVTLIKSGAAPEPLPRWLGVWQFRYNSITLTSIDGRTVQAKGNAAWVRAGIANVGEIEASGVPRGDMLILEEGDPSYSCVLKLLKIGNVIAAQDNLRCGGLNVSFSGLYSRSPASAEVNAGLQAR